MNDCLQNFYCVVNVSDNLISLISLLKDSSSDELESVVRQRGVRPQQREEDRVRLVLGQEAGDHRPAPELLGGQGQLTNRDLLGELHHTMMLLLDS